MRKIETEMNQAIRNGHAWSKDNTCITYDPTNNMSAEVYLHGNHIATVTDTDLTLYSGGGWFTNTTKRDSMHLSKSFVLRVLTSFKRIGIGMLEHLTLLHHFTMALFYQ